MAEPALELDYQNPNHVAIYQRRSKLLAKLRDDADLLRAAKIHYANNQWDFIRDWGMTFDPRAVDEGRPSVMPFVPWPRQVDYLKWVSWMWANSHRGQAEKSRDCGVTWLTVGWACATWCTHPGFVCGFGSRKADQVDKTGEPRSIFWMLRFFLRHVPPEFLPPEYVEKVNSAHMRINDPGGSGAITGEAGDQIGRGGRTSIYFLDEAAFVEHQDQVAAALSANTNCQIDISTFNGPGNRFHRQNLELRKKAPEKVFIFDWRDDPRKDEAWAEKKQEELNDPVAWAMEYDRDAYAAQQDAFIPAAWVRDAIDAHVHLGFGPSGMRAAAFDPADEGDAKAYVARHGSVVFEAEQLTKGDITQAIPWAYSKAFQDRVSVLGFDADGLGGPSVKMGLANGLTSAVRLEEFHAATIVDPDEPFMDPEKAMGMLDEIKTNQDAYRNGRAQFWHALWRRFKAVHDAMQAKRNGHAIKFDPDEMISISGDCKDLEQLRMELSAPKRLYAAQGKIQIESKAQMRARGIPSPNLADGLMMCFSLRPPKPGRKRSSNNAPSHQMTDSGAGY